MGISDKILRKAVLASSNWMKKAVGNNTALVEKVVKPRPKPSQVEGVERKDRDIVTEAYDYVRDSQLLTSVLGPNRLSGVPLISRPIHNVRNNVTIFQPDYYKALNKLKSGDLSPGKVDRYKMEQNLKLIGDAIKDSVKYRLQPKLNQVAKKTGISPASLTEIGTLQNQKIPLIKKIPTLKAKQEKLLAVENKTPQIEEQLKGIEKEYRKINQQINRLTKQQDHQIKANLMENISSGRRQASLVDVGADTYFSKHNLPQNVVDDIIKAQKIDKTGLKPWLVKPKNANYYNDMNRARNLQLVDWTIAHGKKSGMSMEEIARQINKDIKITTKGEFRKHKTFKNMDESQLDAVVNQTMPPHAVVLPDGTLKVNTVIMSGDFTAGYAPTITYVGKDFKVKRVLHDAFDGGEMNNLKLDNIFKNAGHNTKVMLNKAYGSGKDRVVVQVSNIRDMDFTDGKLSTIGVLRNSELWKKVSGRTGFKRAVNKVALEYKITPESAEDALLIMMDNVVSAKVAKGKGPLIAMQEVLSKFQTKNMSNTQLLMTVQKELQTMGPEGILKLIQNKGVGVDYLSSRRTSKATRKVIAKDKHLNPIPDNKKPKLGKNVDDLIEMGASEYNRGTGWDDIIKFGSKAAVKGGIAGGLTYGGKKVADSIRDNVWSLDED